MENNNSSNDFMTNLNNMMKSGTIPDNIMNMLNNMKNNNTDNSNANPQTDNNSINPDMISNLMNMLNNSNNSNNNSSSNNNSGNNSMNIDIEMLMKMKNIIDKMNSNKDDPRANLLHSLKPYLKQSRKNKVEQYIQLFNMSKIMEIFNSNGGENTK